MKALVTGANGFIGGHLVRALLKKGILVKALVRKTSSLRNLEGLNMELFYGDLKNFSSLRQACLGCDLLFHAAAFYDFWAPDSKIFYEINVEGTKSVLEAARQTGVPKIVYTSTVGTIRYPDDPQRPSDETCCPSSKDLHNDYKKSKFLAEEVVFQFAKKGLPVVIVNPSTPVGPLDIRPTPTGKIIVDFLKGKIPAYINTGLNIIDVEDVAQGHLLAALKGKVGERYILGNKNISLKEIYELLGRLSGKKPPKLRLPYSMAFLVGLSNELFSKFTGRRPPVSLGAVKMARKYMYFSSAKAIQELGLPQSPIERAFEKAILWFHQNGFC